MDNQNNQNEQGKEGKKFESTMRKLIAIVGGEEKLFPEKKVSGDTVKGVVNGLLKERKEKLEKETTAELSALLDKYVAFKKEVTEKKKEFEKIVETKQKEFNEAASKVFNKIDGINELESAYYSTLTELGNAEEGPSLNS